MCGAATGRRCSGSRTWGRSPRVRGSRRGPDGRGEGSGSIPACAGQPGGPGRHAMDFEVDPRVCGAACSVRSWSFVSAGRSPRVRGSHHPRRNARDGSGSIPACAGQPSCGGSRPRHTKVDPRVCGAAASTASTTAAGLGRSPRVRGSQERPTMTTAYTGSIPACAGQPRASWRGQGPRWVDPRVCGAAVRAAFSGVELTGRSPRVRGSQTSGHNLLRCVGSIPACAGQPGPRARAARVHRVDPRVCGAAVSLEELARARAGRSPRVRGSPHVRRAGHGDRGSIPACAGQPLQALPRSRGPRVDPRVCGAAVARSRLDVRRGGRSPRVRGSLRREAPHTRAPGSIPACAGQPGPSPYPRVIVWVDPRVCGAAFLWRLRRPRRAGRSPRVRGSRRAPRRRAVRGGSIPACAGQPRP